MRLCGSLLFQDIRSALRKEHRNQEKVDGFASYESKACCHALIKELKQVLHGDLFDQGSLLNCRKCCRLPWRTWKTIENQRVFIAQWPARSKCLDPASNNRFEHSKCTAAPQHVPTWPNVKPMETCGVQKFAPTFTLFTLSPAPSRDFPGLLLPPTPVVLEASHSQNDKLRCI